MVMSFEYGDRDFYAHQQIIACRSRFPVAPDFYGSRYVVKRSLNMWGIR